ncbi:MAG: hypothetical protein WAT33_05340 [Giesbergeria sp.]
MTSTASYSQLEDLGRVRLSANFFMRDFLYSEIAAWNGMRNVPDSAERAIYAGSRLCTELLEPLQATFGRIHIRSGYRSPAVNDFGNRNKLNCASNESNYAAHIWDHADTDGKVGATACIVVPWLVDHVERGASWTDMAWWVHDHLPYSSLFFFTKLTAFNINWHETPVRRADSYAAPKGCLIRPGTPGHPGLHAQHYRGFPAFQPAPHQPPRAAASTRPAVSPATTQNPPSHPAAPLNAHAATPAVLASKPPAPSTGQGGPVLRGFAGGKVHYRAVHTKTRWRVVNSHQGLDSAIHGTNGAHALFRGKVRIDYAAHGEPLYVLVWQEGSSTGFVLGRRPGQSDAVQMAEVPVARLQEFERQRHATNAELAQLLQ